MRLAILESGFTRRQQTVLRLIGRYMDPLPGPLLTMSYRRAFFGKWFSRAIHEAMRCARHWSVPDVELFAAFVSAQNHCHF